MTGWIVLDLGQVLASPADLYRTPAGFIGADPDRFAEHYWTDRRAYDTGIPVADYWQPFLERLQVDADAELIERLSVVDATLWTKLRPSALALLHTVRDWRVPLALLSNAPLPMGPAVRASDWADLFDRIFISAEMGTTKPDPAIYAEVTQSLGAAPAEIAFIDDRLPNVDAARDFGWQAHLWVDDADSLAWLRTVCGR